MAESFLLELRAIPGASRDEVTVGPDGIRARVRAPAVDGRANDAVGELIADRLGLHRRAVRLERGATARRKCFRVEGLERQEALRRLASPAQP